MTTLELAWYGCNLRTGVIAEELPSLTPSGTIGRKLGAVTSATFALDLAGAPAEWEAATDEGRTMLVGVDTATDTPLWAGIVLNRIGGSDQQVQLAAASPEAYLDRRYPGDYVIEGADQTDVMTALATAALTDGPPLTVDATSTGVAIDYTMADSDDRTILSALQEISGMSGGPEWTIDVVWADGTHRAFALVLRIRPTIGVTAISPEAVFDFPGCVASYTLAESYEKGRGATSVVARGDQSDGVRATSELHTADAAIADGWALWEHRYTPAQGITDPEQLDRHATEALALMTTGSRAWSLEAVASAAPRLGEAWGLGDTIQLSVAPRDVVAGTGSLRHPAGIDVVARAYAWTLDPAGDKVTPILLEDE
ncbi:hypothetical protein ABZY44_23940 [Streptomyces sp. NPDC006544]|uniref:hypothetical protein n=1 Tax=Streptomyces sp. NPDC006544 TaxID=3154583 RepID=UPI0033AD7523